MAQIDITRMSSKGQIVIPVEMRKGIEEGEKLILIKNGHQIIIEKVADVDENFEADMEFAKRTEEAWKSYDRREFKKMEYDEFLDELEKW